MKKKFTNLMMKNKRGQLALDVVEGVILKVLIIAILGVAVILALTTLNTGVGTITDITTSSTVAVTNESDDSGVLVMLNSTGYTLSGYNSSWSPTVTAVWGNLTTTGNTPYLIPVENYSLTSGVLKNASIVVNQTQYNNVSVSYTYLFTYNNGRTSSISGNVTNGLVSFFGSIGTVFSILLAVVLISAVAVIVLVVRRFAGNSQVSA